jgi:HlyD family secretion protein
VDIPRPQEAKGRKRLIYGGIALAGVVTVTVALSRLQPAAPSVDGGTLWMDTVRQSDMVREVRGPGTLVPEQMRQVTAVTSGRVERILAQPGDTVQPNTILLEMSNPDVELQALQAEQQLAAAQAQLVSLRSQLRTQLLAQEAAVATAQANYNDAKRQADAADTLAKQGLISQQDIGRDKDLAVQTQAALHAAQQQLDVLEGSMDEQLTMQQGQVDRLREVVSFQQRLIASMHVRAGAAGVLRDLGQPQLQEGQWVLAGSRMATVVQPGRLKAELQIPETQARDVMIGQQALVDTRTDTIPGKVIRVDPAAVNGTVTVDASLPSKLPRGARPDLSVDGTIVIEQLHNVLHVGRPAYGQSNSVVGLFRLDPGGHTAQRVNVRLGRSSVNQIEILDGLRKGDVVILSDMSRWDAVDRVRIK